MAARAFICYDKFSDYDRNREAFEGYWDFNYGLNKNYRDAYEMLGLDLKEDCNWPAIVQHVKTAEAEGRSPFILPEPATTVAWREALHPATTAKRLMELAASHAWDVAMRPQLAPELQDILVRHDDVRVRWAIASAPCASEANSRVLQPAPSRRSELLSPITRTALRICGLALPKIQPRTCARR